MPDARTLRAYGVIGISFMVCILFGAGLIMAYITKDTSGQQLLLGGILGAFSTVVGYFVGSSAGSAQKDEAAASRLPAPPQTIVIEDGLRK